MCARVLLIAALLLFVNCYRSTGILKPFDTLQKVKPQTVSSTQLDSRGALPPIQLTAEKLPGCKIIGQYEETQSVVRAAWTTFKGYMDNYIDFHRQQLQKLKSGDSSVRTLTWSCYNPLECCGIGDQLYNIQQALVYAIVSNRVLSLHWNPASYETMKYLQPNKIDWTYFNRSQGMKDHHSRDQYRVGMTRTAEYYEPFYVQLMSEDHVHNYDCQPRVTSSFY